MGRTAMCFTRGNTMSRTAERLRNAAWIVGTSLVMAGCTESRLYIGDEFGQALRQDQAAQIADPDARYKGTPAPGSNGSRAGIAQARYEHNDVIRPTSLTTSTVSNAGGNGGSAGAGTSPGS